MDEFLYELKILTNILEEKIKKLESFKNPEETLDKKFIDSFDKIKNALKNGDKYRPEIKRVQDLIKKVLYLEKQNIPRKPIIKPIIIKEAIFKKYKSTYDFYKNGGTISDGE